jgi:hypothetical protein
LSNLIETGIEPLVEALNRLDFVKTIYSCEGHFDRPPNKKFLPTAYATFSATDVRKFRKLHKIFCDMNKSDASFSLRLTYDCILGLHTLSIWPGASVREPSRKRSIVDSAVRRLSDKIMNHTGKSISDAGTAEDAEDSGAHPCEESVPPCMLVIPAGELICPFTKAGR